MSEQSDEQKQALEAQKAQCPYCMIAAGKIPAKKVYEDDKILAAMEIYPAAKGHIIIFTKEHYPIMPLIPPAEFLHMFGKLKDISASLKQATLSFGTTVFIANGGVAGQKLPHFKIDLIARDKGDKLDNFTVVETDAHVDKIEQALPMFKNNMQIMMQNHFKRLGIEPPTSATNEVQKSFSKEDIIKVIEGNPTFKNLMDNNPEQLFELAKQDESLAKFLGNVDIQEIVNHFKKKQLPETEGVAEKPDERQTRVNYNTQNKSTDSKEKSDIDAVSRLFLK